MGNKNFRLSAFADEADGRLAQQIVILKENGIGYLEIRFVDGQNIADISCEKAKEIRSQLDDNGISVWALGSPYGKIRLEDEFAPHLDKFKRSLDVAEILGTTRIRMFSFIPPVGEADAHEDEVMKRLEGFCDAVKGSQFMLCHENEKGIYGDTADRCLKIHQTFPQIRAVFDPANFLHSNQDIVEAWKILSPYVEYLHIKDAVEDGTVVPAGQGIGQIPYILERFQGQVLTVEPHLGHFIGLDKLETGQKTKLGYAYPSARAAFDAAVNALKKII